MAEQADLLLEEKKPGSSAEATEATEWTDVLCMACETAECSFQPMRLKRRKAADIDITIRMVACGICHTDVHTAAGHLTTLGLTNYPCVPGHELAGVCVAVGSKVTKFKIGDHVGVGCMIDSCRNCANCKAGLEQKCLGQVGTYNAPKTLERSESYPKGTRPLGGYTDLMVVQQDFAILIPQTYPLECAGPVMCAGVTLYDPLMVNKAGPGTKVAIVGLGGLGLIGVKIAKALGCEVLAVSSSEGKSTIAKSAGADNFVIASKIVGSAHVGAFDLVLNTIPVEHDYTLYSKLVNKKGKQVILGLNTALVAGIIADAVVGKGSRIAGSGIGSIKATQEVIDLCAKHDIKPEIKLIGVHEINRVYEELDNSNASAVRYVIDIAGTLNESAFEKCKDLAPPKLKPYAGMSVGDIVGAICAVFCCCRPCC